jgi:hypothetical protein
MTHVLRVPSRSDGPVSLQPSAKDSRLSTTALLSAVDSAASGPDAKLPKLFG